MRLFPNFFLWYFSTTKQYLFILICTGRYDVPFSWNKIARKHGRHGQNLQPRFTFSSENLSDISRYHTLFKTHFWRFLQKLNCWVVGSYVVFRLSVSCAQFHSSSTEFDKFLLVLSKQLCLVVKTTVLCCFPGCGGSPLTSITTAYYAVMRAWRNLLLVAVLRSNWSNVLLIYCQLHHTTPKITRNIQGNPNLRLG